MNETKCRILISPSPKVETGDLASVLADEAEKASPLLAWAEPDLTAVSLDNRTGRREDFCPLVSGALSWHIPIAEARLFWSDASLHVVAKQDEDGCRWVRIEELEDGDNKVLSPQQTSYSATDAEIEERNGEEKVVMRRTYPVLTLRDYQRFGLGKVGEDLSEIGELTAIEYWSSGRLIGWRLALGGGKNG